MEYLRVAPGDTAPPFTLPDETGAPVSLADFRGRRVVLYFYPRDASSGCSIEARQFRDHLPRFRRASAVVLGVSADSVKSHAKFKAAEGLNYPLLSDTGHATLEAYGVWRQKMLYGRKYMGVMRSTVVIGPDGRVERVWEHVAHDGHAAEVYADLLGRRRAARKK